MTPAQSAEVFTAYSSLIIITRDTPTLERIHEDFLTNPKLTANQKDALAALVDARISILTLINSDTQRQPSRESGPDGVPDSPIFSEAKR